MSTARDVPRGPASFGLTLSFLPPLRLQLFDRLLQFTYVLRREFSEGLTDLGEPSLAPQGIHTHGFELFQAIGLSEPDQEKIFSGNARRFFNLKVPVPA